MPAKPEFEPRKLMEMAIEVMKQSVQEPRTDGKPPPKVGALLYNLDGSVQTAYRGELRSGDHAEFALLERKNRHNCLDGAKLFATLERCAPGARNHPKLSCAERIVLARISEVWVGIEDPDPTVDRKGIKFLQDNGVKVHMFDRDLQELIRKENKLFIEQALARAAAAEEKPKAVTLSSIEKPFSNADVRDFSPEALEQYRTISRIPEAVGSDSFNRRLTQQGLLQSHGTTFVPSGFGALLFGTSPRDLLPQAGLLGTIHYPNGKEETRDFDGPQVLVPEQALDWLKNKLPNTIERNEARRRETNEAFYELVREGVVNALVHRDYEINGAKCQLVVTPDTVLVKSPGKPVEPITLEQLQSFNAPMLSRNPALHYVFGKMELAEERGLGLKSMKNNAIQVGLPLPKYGWEAPYLILTLFHNSAAALRSLGSRVLDRLSDDERASWEFIAGLESITSPELMKRMDFDERKAQRVLRKLQDTGLLRRIGKGPATRYQVLRP